MAFNSPGFNVSSRSLTIFPFCWVQFKNLRQNWENTEFCKKNPLRRALISLFIRIWSVKQLHFLTIREINHIGSPWQKLRFFF